MIILYDTDCQKIVWIVYLKWVKCFNFLSKLWNSNLLSCFCQALTLNGPLKHFQSCREQNENVYKERSFRRPEELKLLKCWFKLFHKKKPFCPDQLNLPDQPDHLSWTGLDIKKIYPEHNLLYSMCKKIVHNNSLRKIVQKNNLLKRWLER